jgi:hypothetical protein
LNESKNTLKRPKVKDLSKGNVAPIPNQRATAVPIKKTVVATGRRKGFWNHSGKPTPAHFGKYNLNFRTNRLQ